MQEIKIESKISSSDYIRLLFRMIYRKPGMIILSFTGLIMVIFSTLYFLNLYTLAGHPPYLPLVTGILIIVVFPLFVYGMARHNFRTDSLLREKIQFSFSGEKILLRGETFLYSLTWDKIHKVRIRRDWLLFYGERSRLNFMVRHSLTRAQQKEFEKLVKLSLPS